MAHQAGGDPGRIQGELEIQPASGTLLEPGHAFFVMPGIAGADVEEYLPQSAFHEPPRLLHGFRYRSGVFRLPLGGIPRLPDGFGHHPVGGHRQEQGDRDQCERYVALVRSP